MGGTELSDFKLYYKAEVIKNVFIEIKIFRTSEQKLKASTLKFIDKLSITNIGCMK